MSTPLYDALKDYAARRTARFHMPGHKGRWLPIPELAPLAPLDVTEIPGTGNLYEAGEPSTPPRPCGPKPSALTTASSSPAAPPWGCSPA